LLVGWTALAVPVLLLLLFVRAPFGRHARPGWGPTIPNRIGWILMESPSIWWFSIVFLSGQLVKGPLNWLFFALWMAHYLHRDLVYPLRVRDRGTRIPLLIVLFAFLFQIVNGYLNGAYLGRLGRSYEVEWLADPRFVVGIVLFLGGAAINLWADSVLLALRRPGETGYRKPEGGLYRWISCPNYLGEIIQWSGWALATWSPAGLSFALWTIANLAPRALAHHRWYKETFPDYPAERRALVPGIL
jgi:protein-S-isoprenylcysteine O-methyltransferase Ste14